MRKILSVLSVGILAFVLTACNSSATPTKETTNKSSLTLAQVYDNAIERQEEIKSMSASINMSQVMSFNMDGEATEMTIGSQMEMDLITQPLAMHMTGTMTMPNIFGEAEADSAMPIEMYMKQDQGFFMKDVATDSWLKLPNESFDQILDQTAASADAKEQLEQLRQYINDFTFEQTNDTYVLTLNAEGGRFKELIKSQMKNTMPDALSLEENPLDAITIDKVNYVIYIDKETFDTNKMDMKLDLKMKIQGEDSTISTKSVITYTDINNLNTIDIPQNIIDHATVVKY